MIGSRDACNVMHAISSPLRHVSRTSNAQGGTFLDATNKDVRVADIDYEESRALADILAEFGNRWTVLVVYVLFKGDRPLRYNEIMRVITGISQRMLTLTLRKLESTGIVSRTVYPTSPPQVEYSLTELGIALVPPLRELWQWAIRHSDTVRKNREHYNSSIS